MKPLKKLTSQQQTEAQQHVVSGEKLQSSSQVEFANPEELLRHDALHTPVPPKIAERLEKSLENLPAPPPRSWWRRLFGS